MGNIIGLATLIIGVPAGILAWKTWQDDPQKQQSDREAVARQERSTTALENQAAALGQIATRPAAMPEASPRPAPAPPPQVIITQPRADNGEAALTRPYVYLKSWQLAKAGLNERAEWIITTENTGRPASVSTTQFQEVAEREISQVIPSCKDTITFGSSHPMKGEQRSIFRAHTPMDEASWNAFNSGTPIILSATFCYKDEITKRQHVTHICLKGYADKRVMQCAKGNDAS